MRFPRTRRVRRMEARIAELERVIADVQETWVRSVYTAEQRAALQAEWALRRPRA